MCFSQQVKKKRELWYHHLATLNERRVFFFLIWMQRFKQSMIVGRYEPPDGRKGDTTERQTPKFKMSETTGENDLVSTTTKCRVMKRGRQNLQTERDVRDVCVCVRARVLSHVWLFATPWTVTHQAPVSMELSRQEYWSGLAISFSRGSFHPGIEPMSLASLTWQPTHNPICSSIPENQTTQSKSQKKT